MRHKFFSALASRKTLWVMLPLALIGAGIALAMLGYVSPGIIVTGAGLAIIAFSKACTSIDLEKAPAAYRKRSGA